jgi:hypothetical protein
LLKDR